jgi:hypothetical protein
MVLPIVFVVIVVVIIVAVIWWWKNRSESPEGSVAQTGGFTGDIIKVELDGNDRVLSISELEVYSGGKNVALKGKASQSSAYDASKFPPEKAIDGVNTGEYPDFTHTKDQPAPSFTLVLDKAYPIDLVKIYNRVGYESRMDKMTVTITNSETGDSVVQHFLKTGRYSEWKVPN